MVDLQNGLTIYEGDELKPHQIESLGEVVGRVLGYGEVSIIRTEEIADLYWNSDIPTREICEAYGLRHTHELIKIAGPAALDGVVCRHCGGNVIVKSRTEGRRRQEQIALRVNYPAAWANPDVCDDCSTQLKSRQDKEWAEDEAARWQRQQDLRSMPYREYLNTPEWQATRAAALKRARFHCQTCSSTSQLNVHHRTYVRRGAEYNSDLIVLCAGCHQIFHENTKLVEGGRASA